MRTDARRLPRRHRPQVAAAPGAAAPAVDPVQALIDESQQHYRKGQRDLDFGHLDRARNEFNRAIDVLLNAPGGARTEPRLREQFDRLVDRISAFEVAALATGDGFAEKPAEPASIDELLALSATFDDAGADARRDRDRRDRPARRRRTTFRFP